MSLAKFLLDFLTEEKFFIEVLIVPGAPPKVRTKEGLIPLTDKPTSPDEVKGVLIYLRELAGKVGALGKRGVFTFAYRDLGRIRVIYGMQRNAYYLSLLRVPFNPPPPEEFFQNPAKFEKLAEVIYHERGKIYVAYGEDWFINATLIAEIFNYLLEKGGKVILTVENPLAYMLKHKNGLAIQKELYEDIMQPTVALEDVPLIIPDYIYIFDALNIYQIGFGEIFRYIPRGVDVFLNFPMKGKIFVKSYLEKIGVEKAILLETAMDTSTGLVDFNVTSTG